MIWLEIDLAEMEGGEKPRNEKQAVKFVRRNIGELIRLALLKENQQKEKENAGF